MVGGAGGAGAKIELPHHRVGVGVDQADAVILEVGDQQPRAVRADGEARRRRLHVQTKPGLVAKGDRPLRRKVTIASPREGRHCVVHAAGGVDLSPVLQPGETEETVGQAEHVGLDRLLARDVVEEHELRRGGEHHLALGVPVAVEAAGEDGEGAPVRRDGEVGRLSHHIVRQLRHPRVQGLEHRPRRKRGRIRHALKID